MAKTEPDVQMEKAARGQTIVTSRMPVRDSGSDSGKNIKKVKGEGNDLSRTMTSDGKVPSY